MTKIKRVIPHDDYNIRDINCAEDKEYTISAHREYIEAYIRDTAYYGLAYDWTWSESAQRYVTIPTLWR
jgi:hypothetical protein